MPLMSVTLDTPHSLIDPCWRVEQPTFGNSLRQELTAPLSSALDRGKNAEVVPRASMCVCVCVCVRVVCVCVC